MQQNKLYGFEDDNIVYHILVGDRRCPYRCSFCRISENTTAVKKPIDIADEMIEYYRKADLVLIPSIYEGFGIVAVEAMNSCVPVFTTCAGGLSEIIDNNFNGIKITLDNLDLVADKIVDFIQNSKFQEQIVINAKYTITEKFTKERHMNYISKIYDEVLKCH